MKIIFVVVILLITGCSISPFHQARDSFISDPDTNEAFRGWVPAEMPENEWSVLKKAPKSKRDQQECVTSLKKRMPRNAELNKVKPAFTKCMNKLNWKLVAIMPKATAKIATKVNTNKVGIKDSAKASEPIDKGVWFENEVTGKLYQDYDKAGVVSRVRINGKWYSKENK